MPRTRCRPHITASLLGHFSQNATVFSFYANKPLTTGEGGMLVTRNDTLATHCKVMRLHGISRDCFNRYCSPTPSWQYEIIAPGFKYNLTDIASAIGIHQLRRVHEMHNRRVAIAARYDQALGSLPVVLPPHAELGDLHSWHLYVLRLRPEAPVSRNAYIEQMAAAGIECSVHYTPLHRQPYWRDRYGLRPEQFPAAEEYYRGAVTLPLFSRMSDEEVERVIRKTASLLGG